MVWVSSRVGDRRLTGDLEIDLSEKFNKLSTVSTSILMTLVTLIGIQCWNVSKVTKFVTDFCNGKILFWMFLSTVRIHHILIPLIGYHGYKTFRSNKTQDSNSKFILAFCVVALVSIYAQGVTNNAAMCMSPPEVTHESIVHSTQERVKAGNFPAQRPHHSDTLGCLAAQVTVEPAISIQYRHGLFQEPGKKYNAAIRMSSGDLGGKNLSTKLRKKIAILSQNFLGIFFDKFQDPKEREWRSKYLE
jgi:hypothetical protein